MLVFFLLVDFNLMLCHKSTVKTHYRVWLVLLYMSCQSIIIGHKKEWKKERRIFFKYIRLHLSLCLKAIKFIVWFFVLSSKVTISITVLVQAGTIQVEKMILMITQKNAKKNEAFFRKWQPILCEHGYFNT